MANEFPDLFPGFKSETVETEEAQLFCRVGGSGPPLVLLHGYPQSHTCWHKVAPLLAERFTLVLPDLPGYGSSSIPALSQDHHAYSKRTMANSIVELMRLLGFDKFHLAGHDRGGRVAYRLALDHPHAVSRVAVLDILPTFDYWEKLDRQFGLKVYHWMFLAQPAPFPEKLIAASPVRFLEHTLASWTGNKSLDCFSEEALDDNRAWFRDPDRISATCEDYRAGATIDFEHDSLDHQAGNQILIPLLALWGEKGIATSVESPLDVWRSWCPHAEGQPVPGGHFLPEEAWQETADALRKFFAD
ncbi:alpha/beta hydrolase [Roseibium porphyridii]|uniref:Alpha/beta hydrolase n=1 Tax=Roseibium porphyridii TaxID=2866279 RepID=A0ABY8F0I9_9HYPH|nr:alpha/beta hydrolase [Roseibium sp. KMA01]WFE88973.1 alpha/beta hydrolase [Roseibium sp. KMA01]